MVWERFVLCIERSELYIFEETKAKNRRSILIHRARKSLKMKLVSILTYALAACSLPAASDASAAAGAALKALKSMDYRFFVAGGTCAAFSHGITCPIDVVKVR